MDKGCKFCKGLITINPPIYNRDEEVIGSVDSNLFIREDIDDYELPINLLLEINYCPSCGRKLRNFDERE